MIVRATESQVLGVLGCRYGMEDSASNEAEETYKKWLQAGSIKRLDF